MANEMSDTVSAIQGLTRIATIPVGRRATVSRHVKRANRAKPASRVNRGQRSRPASPVLRVSHASPVLRCRRQRRVRWLRSRLRPAWPVKARPAHTRPNARDAVVATGVGVATALSHVPSARLLKASPERKSPMR